MPTTSRVAAVQDGLLTILQQRAGLAGVPVDLGFPSPNPESEHVWIPLDVEDWRQDLALTDPNGERDERFTLRVVIWVDRDGASPKEARDRCIALAEEVEKAVRENPLMEGFATGVQYVQVAGGRHEEGVREDGRQHKIALDVAVEASIGSA